MSTRKNKLIISVFINIALFINTLVFADVKELDDFERSIKDMKRTMKQDSLKDMELQRDYQLPQQKIKPFEQDLIPKDKPATDKAMLRNQERLKELMNAQKGGIKNKVPQGEGHRIPTEQRLIIEVFVIALFITVFGFIFYRRKIKRHKVEVKSKEDKEYIKEQRRKLAQRYLDMKQDDDF